MRLEWVTGETAQIHSGMGNASEPLLRRRSNAIDPRGVSTRYKIFALKVIARQLIANTR
jgi:hypothetical protein